MEREYGVDVDERHTSVQKCVIAQDCRHVLSSIFCYAKPFSSIGVISMIVKNN